MPEQTTSATIDRGRTGRTYSATIENGRSSRTYMVGFDQWMLGAYVLLCLAGLYFMLDIQSTRPSLTIFYKHLVFCLVSVVAMLAAFRLADLTRLRKLNFAFMLLTLGLLTLVLFIGTGAGTVRRFLPLGPINVQPSVIARVMLIFYVAHLLDKKKNLLPQSTPVGLWRHFKPLLIVPAITYGLILSGRHFSTLVISGVTVLSMMWLGRVRMRTMLLTLCIIAVGGVLVLTLGEGYRRGRMNIFRHYSLYGSILGAENHELQSDAYQVQESLVALSSGRTMGTGASGGRSKYLFLPEAGTDYVFSIIGEEVGFIGATLVVLLFGVLFYRGLFGAWRTEDFYLQLLGAGLSLNIFLNAMVNIGVAMSALPSTGVTLPFISYGGTSMLVNSVSVGLLLNISARRRTVW
ncbi:MAG: FtsW/RodA/SpoVE family cell cycle protein [Candidatus Cloacimonetes bacterium]|nr:FtsW/RodA/SpoVE family cell cycle protein [Candidatus Cloacimonadota bacterium]